MEIDFFLYMGILLTTIIIQVGKTKYPIVARSNRKLCSKIAIKFFIDKCSKFPPIIRNNILNSAKNISP